jgi:hypothetical protein
LVGIGVIGFALNWIMLLAVLPSGGVLSSGARMLVFGIVFPVGWLIAAQPFAVASGLSRFYRWHRDEVLSLIAGALQSEAGAGSDQAQDRWIGAVEALRAHINQYPRALRALLQLGLRRAPIGEIETALRTGSGPPHLRIAGDIADHLEAELARGASALWLVVVAAGNLLASCVVYLMV